MIHGIQEQNTDEIYKPDVVLIGTGIQGISYVKELLEIDAAGLCRFVGAIDPQVQTSEGYNALCAAGIPTYCTPEAFFDTHTADLCCIAVLAHLQPEYAVLALRFGCHVLCDGLFGGALRDWLLVEALAEKEFKFAAIHDVWTYGVALRSLKRDVDYGFFGKAKHLTVRLYASAEEELLSGAARAMQVMLYLLGRTEAQAAVPVCFDTERLRVENEGGAEALVIRMHMPGGIEATLYAMCGKSETDRTELRFQYERGEIFCGTDSGNTLRVVMDDGGEHVYGALSGMDTMQSVRTALEAVDADYRNWNLPCTVRSTVPCRQVLAAIGDIPISNVPAAACSPFPDFPKSAETAEECGLWELLGMCCARGCLLSELAGEGMDALRACLLPRYECWLPEDFMDMRAFAAFYEGRPAHRIDEGPTFEERWMALTGATGKKRSGKRKKK